VRVLVVTSQLPPDIGGTSVYAREIACGLARAGDEVTVAIRDRDPKTLDPIDVPVETIDTKRGLFKPLRLRRARRRVLELVREKRADVVLFAYPVVGLGDIYGTLAREKIPFVVSVHGINKSDLATPSARARRVSKWGLAHANLVIANTAWMADQLVALGIPRERVIAVPLGVDQSIPDRAPDTHVAAERERLGLEGKRVLLSLGRLAPRKNFDALLRALPAVSAKVPDLAYVVVGSGSEEARWKALAHELGVAPRVTWVPACRPQEVGRYYKLGDVFVTVSRTRPEDDSYESFGLVYVEANLCGRAVVAGNEAGAPEAVVHGETGLLVSPDDPRGLEEALVRLLTNEALRRSMGEAGARRARELFTWENASKLTHDVLARAASPD
jgi:phosphatidylinositol alpha-1,6-mannosyltransferase